MSRIMTLGSEARSKLASGVKKLYDAVGSTLGPGGRTVIIEDQFGGSPVITKDGVTVAKNFTLKDQAENLGVEIVKQVASKTEELVGDGTTTATVLAYNIYNECINKIAEEAHSNEKIIKSLTRASKFVVDRIEADTNHDVTEDDVYNIAMISSNGDEELSKVIVEAFKSVTKDGSITVDSSESIETSLKITPGMEFMVGYSSPLFITDMTTEECILKDCCVYLSSSPVVYTEDILTVMSTARKIRKSLLVVAPVVTGEALSLLTSNKLQGKLECCAINLPRFRTSTEVLHDISILTGSKIVNDHRVMTEQILINDKVFGNIKLASVSQNSFIIKESSVDKSEIEAHIENLKSQVLPTLKKYQLPGFENRIAKLTSGIATIQVGGRTEADQKERKDRADDATFAVKAAISGGTVVGGGKELYNISLLMENNDDVGYKILANSLKAPYKLILENADHEFVDLRSEVPEVGIDVRNNIIGNLRELGILDPADVTKSAFMNAISIVKLLLSTNVLLINEVTNKTPLTDKLFD